MAGIRFAQKIILRERKASPLGTFYLQVFLNSERIREKLEIEAPYDLWDPDAQQVKGKSKEVKDINLSLEKYKALASDIVVRYRLMNKPLTTEVFLSELRNPLNSESFTAYFAQDLENRKNLLRPGSYRQHKKVLNNLKRFRKSIAFSDIHHKFLKEFEMWLSTARGNGINTRFTNFKVIKCYWNRAKRDGLVTENPFENFPLKKVNGMRTWLTLTEVTRLHQLLNGNAIREEYEEVSLKAFLFSCRTGMRISDVRKAHSKNVMDGTLEYIPIKTQTAKNESISIPLDQTTRELTSGKGLFFPKLPADQQVNRYLKKFAQLAGIDKNLSFHVARHTFATNMYRETKDVLALKKFLGHSKIEDTMIYVNMAGVDQEAAMKKYITRLNHCSADQKPQASQLDLAHFGSLSAHQAPQLPLTS